jgi:hypothetical protein
MDNGGKCWQGQVCLRYENENQYILQKIQVHLNQIKKYCAITITYITSRNTQ